MPRANASPPTRRRDQRALDLLQGALAGASTQPFDEVGFALPSRMDPTALAALAGRATPESFPE
jgi:hypothetical protein